MSLVADRADPRLGHNGGPRLDDAPPRDRSAARKALLAGMERALAATRRQREEVRQHMWRAAEAQVRERYPEWESCHWRGQSRWSKADERAFDANLVQQHFARGRELDALDDKAARQSAAIAAFRRKHGFNASAGH